MQPIGFDKTGFDRPYGQFNTGAGTSYLRRILNYGSSLIGKSPQSPFATFYYRGEIVWIQVTKGYTDPTTGAWIPATTTETPIVGRIQDELTGKIHRTNVLEERQAQPGRQILGNRVLRTKENLQIGDQIRVREEDGRLTTWAVEGQQTRYNLFKKYLNLDWTGYMLKQIKSSP